MAKRGPKSADVAPTPLLGAPRPPAWLDKEGKAHWREVADLAEAAGYLSRLDRDALTAYCELWSKWRHAEARAKEDGPVIVAPNKYLQVNPWYSLAVGHLAAMKPYLEMFGMTPKARSKLRLPDAEEKDTRWDEDEG